MVNCTEDFKDQPKVINGYSDLMVEIFGEKENMQGQQLVCMHCHLALR